MRAETQANSIHASTNVKKGILLSDGRYKEILNVVNIEPCPGIHAN